MGDNNSVSWDSRRVGLTRRPVVFVSSSVYDKEDMLRQIHALLATNGYEPWMSFKGTLAAASYRSAFENCLHAVSDADLFIGIITPWYGSGVDKDDHDSISITHQEMREARDLGLPRLLLVDERVVWVRQFLDSLGFKGQEGRKRFKELLGKDKDGKAVYLAARHSCDVRSVDLYDEMVLGEPNDKNLAASKRIGNWIQGYRDINDVKDFLSAQLSYLKWPQPFVGHAEAVARIAENFQAVRYQSVKKKGGMK